MRSVLINIAVMALSYSRAAARPMTAAQLIAEFEDLPWEISNLSINIPSGNLTHNQFSHVTFNAVDRNPESLLNTTCGGATPDSLYTPGYSTCQDKSAAFSLREDGTLWFRHQVKTPTGSPFCLGNWPLKNAKYYSKDAIGGLVVVDPFVRIPCTAMVGG